MSETRLILHVKGTEDQTTELPKKIVRAAIAQGQISRSQLIWSTAHNAWKEVRELPHLLPSQKLAPAPQSRVTTVGYGTGPVPRVATGSGSIPRVGTGPIPRATARTSEETPATHEREPEQAEEPDYRVEKEKGLNPLKWLCIGLGFFILALVGMNYLLVDRPLVSQMSQTPFAKVTVYAHLGAFVQPGMLIIHIQPSADLTSLNLTDFLVALAHSTPEAPVTGNPFERVVLTDGWMGQYSFSGYAWKEFGQMGQDDLAQRKEFLMDQLGDTAGQPIVTPNPALDDASQQAERDKAWTAFINNFAKP